MKKRRFNKLLFILIPAMLLAGTAGFCFSIHKNNEPVHASTNKAAMRLWLHEITNNHPLVELTNITYSSDQYNEDDVYTWFATFKGQFYTDGPHSDVKVSYRNGHLLLDQQTMVTGTHYEREGYHWVYQFPFFVSSYSLKLYYSDAYKENCVSNEITITQNDGNQAIAFDTHVNIYNPNLIDLDFIQKHTWEFPFTSYEKNITVHYPDNTSETKHISSYESFALHLPDAPKSGYKFRCYSYDYDGKNIISTPVAINDNSHTYYAQAVKDEYTYYVQYSDGTPYLYVYRGGTNNVWPGKMMTKLEGTSDIYYYTSSFSAEFFVINDGNGKQSPDINCNTIGSKGLNNMYYIDKLDKEKFGSWISMNEYIHPNGPTCNTFRVFLNKQGNYVDKNQTWTYHYWNNSGSIDVEILCTNCIKAADNGDKVDEIWHDYFDIPKEAIGLKYQFKLYVKSSGYPYNYSGSDIQISTSSLVYTSGDDANVWYLNNSGNGYYVSMGALCDYRTNYHSEYLVKVLQAYLTCSSDKDNGCGSFNTLESMYKLASFPETTLVDYLEANYNQDRGGDYKISSAIKLAMMRQYADTRVYLYRNSFSIDSPTTVIVMIVAVSSVFILTSAGMIFVVRKRK